MPTTSFSHIFTIANPWRLESTSIFCANDVMYIALWRHLSPSIFNVWRCWVGRGWGGEGELTALGRVWPHIFWGGIWENGKYLDGKQYISVDWYSWSIIHQIWSQDAGFFCLSVRNSEDFHDLNIPFSSNAGFSYNRSGNVGSQPLLLDSGRLVEYGRKFTHFWRGNLWITAQKEQQEYFSANDTCYLYNIC